MRGWRGPREEKVIMDLGLTQLQSGSLIQNLRAYYWQSISKKCMLIVFLFLSWSYGQKLEVLVGRAWHRKPFISRAEAVSSCGNSWQKEDEKVMEQQILFPCTFITL